MALSPIPGLHPVGRRLRPLRALRTLPQRFRPTVYGAWKRIRRAAAFIR